MLISLLIFVIIAALVWWLITLLPLPAPLAQIVQIVFVVVCVIVLIGFLTGSSGFGHLNFGRC